MPQTDTLPGGTGSIFLEQATITLPYPAKSTHTVTIAAPGVTPASNIMVSRVLEPETAINGGDAEEVEVKAAPGLALDTMLVQLSSRTPIAGPFKICYART